MNKSDEVFSFITITSLIVLSALAFILPFAIIGLLGFGIYKGVIWYNRNKRLPEINKRYALLFDLRNRCEAHSDFIIENASREFKKDYQKTYNAIMYNDNYWTTIIEQKDGTEFYELYEGLNNAVTYQTERLLN